MKRTIACRDCGQNHVEGMCEIVKTTVEYSCHECGLKDVKVELNARGPESLMVWMDYMIQVLADDHHEKCPSCNPESLSEIKIPITGTDKVGGATVN